MKIYKEISKILAKNAYFTNIVDGGSLYTSFKTTKEADHYRIQINTPSIDPDDLKVEINNSNLMVYQQIKVKEIRLPNLIGVFKLTGDVFLEGISAEYEDNLLTVIMPINELSGGFHRNIEIHRN
ncbi:MAG: Hsp20 family protein [Bacteroidota bacterium]